MKVVLLKAEWHSHGGLEKYAERIASAFVKKGARVSVLTTKLPIHQTMGVEYCVLPTSRSIPGFLRLELFDRHVRHWLKHTAADVIFGMDRNRMQTHLRAGNGVHAAYLLSRIASEGRITYWKCRLNPLHRKILELERSAFLHPQLQKVFVNSNMVRQNLLDHYLVNPSKIEVIYNGVEWKERERDFSMWKKGREESFARFDLDPDSFQLLFIGNGYKRKGLDVLLDALSMWKFKDFHLSVVGKDKYIASYRARIDRLGLKGRVRFFGPQPNVTPFYQLADTLAIPSFYDPFANVTVEALAMGLFVISSKQNGGHEILAEQNGTVIEELLDPQAMLVALEHALQFRKTDQSAIAIRSSVISLDFPYQLTKLVDACSSGSIF